MHILLAEDNRVNAFAAQGLLELWGCHVTWVQNGTQALAALESEAYDLVLMDISMPEMDGIETTRQIRQREALTGKRIPIIALTAHTASRDRDLCFQAGMDDYLTKPINAEGMLERLWFWQGSCPWPRK
jgi:two-component system, sensor histidine kinase and response regulator